MNTRAKATIIKAAALVRVRTQAAVIFRHRGRVGKRKPVSLFATEVFESLVSLGCAISDSTPRTYQRRGLRRLLLTDISSSGEFRT